MTPGQDRRKFIRNQREELKKEISKEELVMEDDIQYWKSELAIDKQAVTDREDKLKKKWQYIKQMKYRNVPAQYKVLGLYPAGNLEEFEQKLKEILKMVERTEEQEREGDELASKLQTEDPDANDNICKQRLRLPKRKQESISIEPLFKGVPVNLFYFYRVVSYCFNHNYRACCPA